MTYIFHFETLRLDILACSLNIILWDLQITVYKSHLLFFYFLDFVSEWIVFYLAFLYIWYYTVWTQNRLSPVYNMQVWIQTIPLGTSTHFHANSLNMTIKHACWGKQPIWTQCKSHLSFDSIAKRYLSSKESIVIDADTKAETEREPNWNPFYRQGVF